MTIIPHWIYIVFLYLLGSCIGSFLNVVVWRLPRGKSLLWPPSACPKCGHGLAAYDNIPVFGWLLLAGKCRYCHNPISPRYPIIEAITGLLFVLFYVGFFMLDLGPAISSFGDFGEVEHVFLGSIEQNWAVYGLAVFMVCILLVASLIDAELYIIPIGIPWTLAIVAFVVHALIASPSQPGSLVVGPLAAALAVGATVGVGLSNLLLWLKVLPQSFPQGDPILDWEREAIEASRKEEVTEAGSHGGMKEPKKTNPVLLGAAGVAALALVGAGLWWFSGSVALAMTVLAAIVLWCLALLGVTSRVADELQEQEELPPVATPGEIRKQIAIESLFVAIPVGCAMVAVALCLRVPAIGGWWSGLVREYTWISGLCGSLLGALVAGGVIWGTRLVATFVLGRVAMGQGDTHLMLGIGAVLGAGASVVVFFVAPFCGLAIGLYKWITHGRHEIPYGPYLGLAAVVVALGYRYVFDWFGPGVMMLGNGIAHAIGAQ